MTEMIQRVALALAKASGINDWAKSAHEFEDEARAAIEAMREPTQEMLNAADGPWTDDDRPDLKREYALMINAALKGQGT